MTLDQIEHRADEIRSLFIRKMSLDERFEDYRRANQNIPQEQLDEYCLIVTTLRDEI